MKGQSRRQLTKVTDERPPNVAKGEGSAEPYQHPPRQCGVPSPDAKPRVAAHEYPSQS